jgi:hypothetical protein
MADDVLAGQDPALVTAFNEHEAAVSGPGAHEQFHALVDRLEQDYSVR